MPRTKRTPKNGASQDVNATECLDRGCLRLELLTKLWWGFSADLVNALDSSESVTLLSMLDECIEDIAIGRNALIRENNDLILAARARAAADALPRLVKGDREHGPCVPENGGA